MAVCVCVWKRGRQRSTSILPGSLTTINFATVFLFFLSLTPIPYTIRLKRTLTLNVFLFVCSSDRSSIYRLLQNSARVRVQVCAEFIRYFSLDAYRELNFLSFITLRLLGSPVSCTASSWVSFIVPLFFFFFCYFVSTFTWQSFISFLLHFPLFQRVSIACCWWQWRFVCLLAQRLAGSVRMPGFLYVSVKLSNCDY